MVTLISHSAAETQTIGEAWGREARVGWVVGLTGDLGAGKTQLAKGLARGLGVSGRVQSPSFALVNEHRSGRLALHHIDLYRLETPKQVVGAGLEVYLTKPDGVVVVEWVERWLGENSGDTKEIEPPPPRPSPEGRGSETSPRTGMPGVWFRHVVIKTLSETDREITYEDFGG